MTNLNPEDIRKKFLSDKDLENYQNKILFYEKEYLKLVTRSKLIYKEHEKMSKFLWIFDICDLFTKRFSNYWMPILIDIDSMTSVIGTYALELNAIVKAFNPITQESTMEDKNLLVYYISFCSVYKDFERLKFRILHNQWNGIFRDE